MSYCYIRSALALRSRRPRERTSAAGLLALQLCVGSIVSCLPTFAQTAAITVNANSSLGSVPPSGLGIGVAVYDGNLMDAAVPGLIHSAGYNLWRYPGGSYADIYHWQNNSATAGTGASIAAADTFDNFMSQVRAASGSVLITANYGSNAAGTGGGDPNEAAAWVTYANKTKGYGVKYWEIGNEVYGNGFYGAQWEEDLHSDHSPTAYANNVVQYSKAMKAADSTVKIGLVLATPGSWPDGISPNWNSTVLPLACSSIDFVVMHWYPSNNPLYAPENEIPTIGSTARSLVNQYCGSRASSIQMWVTEGNWNGTQIPGALFASDQFLSWWEHGISSMDWQNLHNGISISNGVNQDSGVLSDGQCSGSICEPPTDTPFPAYYGAQMVGDLTAPGDTLLSASSNTTTVQAHAVKNGSGHFGLMLINKSTSSTYSANVSISGASLASTGTKFVYGSGNSSVTRSSISGLGGTFTVSLPPNSITDVIGALGGGTGGGGNLVADGTYTFTNKNSNLVIDDPGSSTTLGQQMEQYAANGGNNQKWKLTNLGGNNVTLICVSSNLALDMSGASKANGGAAIQWTPSGATNQVWHLTPAASGFYEVTNENSGLALEVPGSSTSNGTLLDQWAYSGGANQQWSIH